MSPFLYDLKKATTLLDKWVKDRVATLPVVYRFPSLEDQEDRMYCLYHRKKGHTLEHKKDLR